MNRQEAYTAALFDDSATDGDFAVSWAINFLFLIAAAKTKHAST